MNQEQEAALAIAAEGPPAKSLATMVRSLKVNSPDSHEFAAKTLRSIKGEAKRVDDLRRSWVDPLNRVVKSINDQFRPVLKAYESAEQTLKGSIGQYTLAVEAERRAAMIAQLPSSAPAELPKGSGVSTRTVTRWRITEPDAIPRHLCSPDTALIGKAVAAGEAVPGVELYTDTITAVRS